MKRSRSLRVLIVDEDPDLRESLSMLLEFGGYQVDTAENGRAAVENVRSSRYDAVILDVHMPVMDGIAAARLIREQPPSHPLLLIAYSCFALVERERAEAAGCFDLILDKGSSHSITVLENKLAELSRA